MVKKNITNCPNSPLLPWIKQSLLVIKRHLDDDATAKELLSRITNPPEKNGLGEQTTIEEMKTNLDILLALFEEAENQPEVALPDGWQGDPTEWSQEDIWDPSKFLTPQMTPQGQVEWITPNKEILRSTN